MPVRSPWTLACLALAAALVAGGAAPAHAEVGEGDRAPELATVSTPAGKRLKLRPYQGKVVVMTFGASWCKPCKKELPAYDKLAKKYKAAGARDVAFVAINIDSERANADKFLKETGVAHMTVGLDPQGGSAAAYEPGTMPTTYVIDKRGIVRHVHPGFSGGDEAKLERLVNGLRGRK